MGLPVSEFDSSPFDEVQRLHNNMTKLVQQRKQDLSYADEFVKGTKKSKKQQKKQKTKNKNKTTQYHQLTSKYLDSEAFLSSYLTRLSDLNTQFASIEKQLDNLPTQMTDRVSL